MVDFAKIVAARRLEGERLREEVKKQPTRIVQEPPLYWTRFQHLIQYHLGEMTSWEEQFCYANIEWLSKIPEDRRQAVAVSTLSAKVQAKLEELEDTYCGSICHAMMQAGIPHSK